MQGQAIGPLQPNLKSDSLLGVGRATIASPVHCERVTGLALHYGITGRLQRI